VPILYDNVFGCDLWLEEELIYGDLYSSALLQREWYILERMPHSRTDHDTKVRVPQ
jgi:hypothetical protein